MYAIKTIDWDIEVSYEQPRIEWIAQMKYISVSKELEEFIKTAPLEEVKDKIREILETPWYKFNK